jgi:hypothetical protein
VALSLLLSNNTTRLPTRFRTATINYLLRRPFHFLQTQNLKSQKYKFQLQLLQFTKRLMLDINEFRTEKGGNPERVRESQRRRGGKVEIVDEIIELDREWIKCTHIYYSNTSTLFMYNLMPNNLSVK